MGLLLQHYSAERAAWTTFGEPFDAADVAGVQLRTDALSALLPVAWRILRAGRGGEVMAVHNGRRWQEVAAERMAQDPLDTSLPWAQPALAMLRRRRDDFDATVPVARGED